MTSMLRRDWLKLVGGVIRRFRFIGFIGVSRHMERYFNYICDGTNVQAD